MDAVRHAIHLCDFAREVGRACARCEATEEDMRAFDDGWDWSLRHSNNSMAYYADAFTRGYMLETALMKTATPRTLTFLGGRAKVTLSDEKASVTLRRRKTVH